MNFELLDYLKSQGLKPSESSKYGIDFTCDRIGYAYYDGEITSVELDKIYNGMRSLSIDEVQLFVLIMPNGIVVDYAKRRKINICPIPVLTDNDDIKQETSDAPKVQKPSDQDAKKDLTSVQANKINVSKGEEVITPKPQVVHKTTKSEQNLSTRDIEDKLRIEQIKKQKKNLKNKTWVIGILLFALFAPVVYDELSYEYRSYKKDNGYKKLDVVEGYTVDPMDFLNNEYMTNSNSRAAVSLEPGTGELFSATEKYEPKSYAANEDNTLGDKSLIAGIDFEPGVYTVNYSGTGRVRVQNGFESVSIYEGDNDYVNISLPKGSELQLKPDDYNDSYKLVLTPQDQYIEYSPELFGIFVYGQSYFDSQLKAYSDEGYIEFYYPFDGNIYVDGKIDNEDGYKTIPGIPGSYIVVED